MKTIFKLSLLVSLVLLLVTPAQAQTNVAPVINTNSPGDLVNFALGLLPSVDVTLTNTFGANELEFRTGPAWKTATATGTTPFLDLAGEYYFARHFGAGGDMVMFGNGAGQNSIDSVSPYFLLRADKGNIALIGILGVLRDFNAKQWSGRVGAGIEYRYRTGACVQLSTSVLITGSSSEETHWLTCLGLGYRF